MPSIRTIPTVAAFRTAIANFVDAEALLVPDDEATADRWSKAYDHLYDLATVAIGDPPPQSDLATPVVSVDGYLIILGEEMDIGMMVVPPGHITTISR